MCVDLHIICFFCTFITFCSLPSQPDHFVNFSSGSGQDTPVFLHENLSSPFLVFVKYKNFSIECAGLIIQECDTYGNWCLSMLISRYNEQI